MEHLEEESMALAEATSTDLATTADSSTTQTRLLEAAIAVFGERGYDRAGVAEMARRAGLTTGAIYSRYSGKAELLVDALDAPMAEHLQSLIAATRPDGPIDTLAVLGNDLIDDQGDCDAVFLEAVVAARREADLASMLRRRLDDEQRRLADLVDSAKAEGAFEEALDTHAVLTFIQALGVGFTVLRMLDAPMPAADDWREVIRTVLTSVSPATEAEPTSPHASSGAVGTERAEPDHDRARVEVNQ